MGTSRAAQTDHLIDIHFEYPSYMNDDGYFYIFHLEQKEKGG